MKHLIICLVLLSVTNVQIASGLSRKQQLTWELGYSSSPDALPSDWMPARVPGAVQLDIAKSKNYGPYSYAENWKDYLWMEDNYYTYRSRFKMPAISEGERLFFVSKGIDYQFEIRLNGILLLEQEGMFTPVMLDLTSALQDNNELRVKVFPAPKIPGKAATRDQAARSVKPAVSYGWDWHPRLIPLGIWDETFLEVQQVSWISDVYVNYKLTDDFSRADIRLQVSGRNLKGNLCRWSLKDKDGAVVAKTEGIAETDFLNPPAMLDQPKLWWTHDHGVPYLYHSEFQLIDKSGRVIQTIESQVGFRRIKLVMNAGAWDEPSIFPKTRSVPPIQFELNGRKIFCKGTNWVNPEIFPGIITRDRYLELLSLAKEVNFNILRIWGGGIVNKESFFELCDEIGILVWQEFPLSCNNYPDDPHYLKILRQESASIISRLRKHPSLALWGGGNELFNSWSGMTDQSLPLRLLNSQCFELDPGTPFIPTSPIMGVGHGHYVFRDWKSKEEVFQEMARSKFTAYTEFGMPAPASVDLLKTIIPPEELWPPKPGTSWESHHAYKAWGANTWLCDDIIEDYFGKAGSLEELVANGQMMQSEGYKCIYEEARRQKPYCSMATNWCYNEPWPTAANNSIVSYPSIPKPGFYAVKNACRPVLASASISKFLWKAGEIFTTRVWILNDSPESTGGGKMTVSLVAGSQRLVIGSWDFSSQNANENQKGPEISAKLPRWTAGKIKLLLEVEGKPGWNSEYVILMKN